MYIQTQYWEFKKSCYQTKASATIPRAIIRTDSLIPLEMAPLLLLPPVDEEPGLVAVAVPELEPPLVAFAGADGVLSYKLH